MASGQHPSLTGLCRFANVPDGREHKRWLLKRIPATEEMKSDLLFHLQYIILQSRTTKLGHKPGNNARLMINILQLSGAELMTDILQLSAAFQIKPSHEIHMKYTFTSTVVKLQQTSD